jgi:hypothetical protein
MPDSPSFFEYLARAEWRFLQEREIGLDLYRSGALGIAVFALGIASMTVFVLAVFQTIPRFRHILIALFGAGLLAAATGLGATYWSFTELSSRAEEIVHETAGPRPVTVGQEAIVVALPFLLGAAILAADVLACLYLGIFWGGRRLLPKGAAKERGARGGKETAREREAT